MSIPLWPSGGIKKKNISLYPNNKVANREIDLRQEIKDLLEGSNGFPQRGHWVLLRRMDTRQRCTCWNEVGRDDNKYDKDDRKYDEPKENCSICGGVGWLYRDELHLTRRTIVSPDIGLASKETITPVGIMNVYYVVYYFQYYVRPTEKDKIIEIDNDTEGKPVRPFSHVGIYNISTCDPLRDINGRIEYWKCSVKQEVV